MLTRQVHRRFGTGVSKDTGLLLADVDDPQRLDDLAAFGRDSPDADAWLTALRQAADGSPRTVAARTPSPRTGISTSKTPSLPLWGARTAGRLSCTVRSE
jgi:hypothetical protein